MCLLYETITCYSAAKSDMIINLEQYFGECKNVCLHVNSKHIWLFVKEICILNGIYKQQHKNF